MNERIKELMKQADYPAPELALRAHKLAELIVQECIEKITTYDLVPGHSAKWEDIYDIHTRLLQDVADEVK